LTGGFGFARVVAYRRLPLSSPVAICPLPVARFYERKTMTYDEDLLVELIAGGDVSQTEIAERVGISRRTVWRIANGHSRPDLQQKIADTVEGYRQAAIRLAAKFMKPLLKKQIEVALEGDGEISRRCREFLLKTFMIVLPEQAAKRKPRRAPDEQDDAVALGMNLMELSPDLKDRIVEELGGPTDELKPVIGSQSSVISERQRITDNENTHPTTESTACHDEADRRRRKEATTTPTDERLLATDITDDTDIEEATVSPSPLSSPVASSQLPVATPPDKSGGDPFAVWVDGPHGKKVYAHAIRAIEEAKAEEAARPTRRRVPRSPP